MKEIYQSLLNARGKYGVWGLALLIVFGVALMVLPGLFWGSETRSGNSDDKTQTGKITQPVSATTVAELEDALSRQISAILSRIKGAGRVWVSVSLENGLEKEYALNATTDQTSSKTEVVLGQGRSEPLIIKEIAPQIRGVLVVAEGAGDSEVRAGLGRAVQTMLRLPAHRVMVLQGESR